MALLPDLGIAGGIALAVFLLTLGVLVIFVETVAPRRLVAVMGACVAVAAGLVLLGEVGLSLAPLGFAAAFLANHAFEWLTTR